MKKKNTLQKPRDGVIFGSDGEVRGGKKREERKGRLRTIFFKKK